MNTATKPVHQIFLYEKISGTNNHCVGVLETTKSSDEIQRIMGVLPPTSEVKMISRRIEIHGILLGEGESIRKQIAELLSGNN